MPTVSINGKMYLTVADAAAKFDRSRAWIAKLCRDGRVVGSVRIPTMGWIVPADWVYEAGPAGKRRKEEM